MPRPPKYIATPADRLVRAPARLHVGTSGWAYPSWKPGFYPPEVPARAFLYSYAAQLSAVEVNYSFRTLPSSAQLQGWLGSTPPGFVFSFKAPQAITHFARLRDCGELVTRFCAAVLPAAAAGKLGPLLFQLPPNFQADASRLRAFLALPAFAGPSRPRIAFEFRHPSWFSEVVYEILRAADAALCIADTDDLTTPPVTTASFHCFRRRRDGGYTSAELAKDAEHWTALASSADVYAFFRHQDEPTGALNAAEVLRLANQLSPSAHPQQDGPR